MARRRNPNLNERELTVARLLPFYSRSEIAEQLNISPRTVRMYADNIRRKLGVERTQEIARVLIERGQMTLPE